MVIDIKPCLFPGVNVEKTDQRFKWKGAIVKIVGERVLVDWDGSKRWHTFNEIRPVVDENPNIFEIASRKAISRSVGSGIARSIPDPPQQPDRIQMELLDRFDFRDGDLEW